MARRAMVFRMMMYVAAGLLLGSATAWGQSISGQVVAADTGSPLEGYFVHVYDSDWNDLGYTPVPADGNYVIPDGVTTSSPLPSATPLHVVARPPEPNLPYIEQFYQLKNPGETPDTISVTSGETLTGIDFALKRGPDNRISGVVKNTLGTLIDTFNGLPLSVTVESETLGYTMTIPVDTNGAYTARYLPPAGDYKVSVWIENLDGCSASFLYALGPDKTVGVDPPSASAIYYAQATHIAVDEATDYANIDIIVDENQPRQISGTVLSDDSQPLSGFEMSVWAEDIEFSGWATTGGDGTYTVCGVPASGALVVAADPSDAESLFYGEFYNDRPSYDAADRVSTDAGDLTGIDFVLASAPPNRVQGQVRDTGGDPLAGKTVFFYSEAVDFSKSAITESDGTYAVAGLEPADDYRISVYHTLEGTEYDFYHFDATRSVIIYEQATPVAVTETADLSGKDIIIGFQGGEITGTVFNADGTAGIPDIRVNAWSQGLQAGGEGVTDSGGRYRIWGLLPTAEPADHYVVGVQSDRFVDHYYDQVPAAAEATSVPADSTGIDFYLETGSTLTGIVSDTGGQPVAGARVAAFSPFSGYHRGTDTGPDGTYTLSNMLPENDYILSVRHPDYQPRWFDGQQREADADPVDLTRSSVVADVTLVKGAVISGTIFLDDETSPAPAGVSVEAFSPTDQTGNGTETRSDGTYEIIGLDPGVTDYIVTVYRPGRPVVYYNQTGLDGIVYARKLASGIDPSGGRDMILPPGVSLSGKVTFNGEPVKGIRVEATATRFDPDLGEEIDYGWGEAFTAGSLAADSNYIITGIRPGTDILPITYTVTLHPPPELARFAIQTLAVPVGGQDVTGVDFALGEAPGRSLSGEIGNLAPGSTAHVNAWSETVRSGNGIAVTGTGSPVSYVITNLVPADDYVVDLTSPDYPRLVYRNKLGWMAPDEVDLSETDAPGIDLTLPSVESLAAISGTITFPEDAPVGETVRVAAISAATGVEREVAVFLGDGGSTEAYTIPALLKADDYRVSVKSRRYRFLYYDGAPTAQDASPVDLSAGDAEGIDFTLETGAAISGRVSKEDAGVPGVEVTAWSHSLGVGGFALSGANGAYVIRGLEAAPDYVVAVNAWRFGLGSFYYGPSGTVRAESRAARISTGTGDVAGIDVAVSDGLTIGGAVRSSDGEALSGVRVSAWSELEQAGNSGLTGSDGAYTIRGLPEGEYDVSAEPDWTAGFLGRTRTGISAGSADVDFALDRRPGSHQVSGTVRDGGGNPAGGIVIEFRTGEGALAGWDVTDADGDWEIEGVATGSYRVTATPPPGSDLAFEAREGVKVGGDLVLPEITLGPGIRITGNVKTGDGAPLPGAAVHAVSINTGYWERTVTNADGDFGFNGAPAAGDMVLTAFKSGYVPKRISDFDPNSVVRLTLFPAGTIRGEVRDVDGAPLADVPVVVTSASQKQVPAFSGSARTDGDGRFQVDGLRTADAQGNPIDDYLVGVAAFTRYTEAGAPIRYLSVVRTGRRTGETVNLLMTRATQSSAEISGRVINSPAGANQYVAVDLVKGSGGAGRFDQHQLLGPDDTFSFRGLEPGVDYILGFGVYTGETETWDVYQWADPGGMGVADSDSHQPPASSGLYSAGTAAVEFEFNPNLLRRSRPAPAGGPGPVKQLRIDISGLAYTGDPSALQGRSTPQDLNRSPTAAVSNSPTVTVTWLPSAQGADERYYHLFNQEETHQINKRNAPMPSVKARKATSQDLSGDYNRHHFHIAVEDDRGRIGETSTLSFVIDTVAPRNVNVRADADTQTESTRVITLQLGATGATEVYISDTRFGEGGQWETYEPVKQWTVPGDDDTATIYVQFRDEATNTANALVEVPLNERLSEVIAVLQVLVGSFADGPDADGNGKVELSDAVLLLQQAAGSR